MPDSVNKYANVIELSGNPGHKHGASLLLTNSINAIPDEYEYLVILEADTWLLSDNILNKYVNRLDENKDAVWAGANWIDKYHSTALDFAIIRLNFIKRHLNLLEFSANDSIESRLYTDIHRLGKKVIEIEEAYPVHLPKAMPVSIQAWGRRRRVFPGVPMVTHHIEDLKGGIEEKKDIANKTIGHKIFPASGSALAVKLYRSTYRFYKAVLKITPKSRWVKGRRFK